MLDTLSPSDPVLLLAVVDGLFKSLPRDVRAWFGPTKDNRIEITKPSAEQRDEFFVPVLEDARRPPNQFPDGTKRKRRVLEELPIAPPVEPRKLTDAELAVQEENDQRVVTLLKWRLGPILTELKRKFKRFTKRAAVRSGRILDVITLRQSIGRVRPRQAQRATPTNRRRAACRAPDPDRHYPGRQCGCASCTGWHR